MAIEYPKKSTSLILGLVFIFSSATEAEAYIDAGSVGMIINLLLAGIVGFLFTMKTYLGKIKNFIKKSMRKKSGHDPES